MKKVLFLICIVFFNTIAALANIGVEIPYVIVGIGDDSDFEEYSDGILDIQLSGESPNQVLKFTICNANGTKLNRTLGCPSEILCYGNSCLYSPKCVYDDGIRDVKHNQRLYPKGNKDVILEFNIIGANDIWSAEFQGYVEIQYIEGSYGFLMFLPGDTWESITSMINSFTKNFKKE